MKFIIGLIVLYVIYSIIKGSSSKKRPLRDDAVTLRVEVSGPGNYGKYPQRSDKPSGPPATWYPINNKVNVKGYDIPGGLIYVGTNLPNRDGFENDACLINPNLPIKPAEPWDAGDEMGYWPQYGHIPAKCRGAYLKWLAGGRIEPEAYIGYVFLFFYGLERRLIVDGTNGTVSSKERSDIVNEVQRLLKIYGRNRSFRGYATNLLAMEWALFQNDKPVPQYIDFDDRYCTEPFQLVLAKTVAARKPIPADMALNWFRLDPYVNLRTPARRCAKEFRSLFTYRYQQKFGDGILVKPNKTRLRIDYRAASPSIRTDGKLKVPDLPDPFILTDPVKKISVIVDECTEELEPYSRFLGRKGSDPKSLTALSLIPKELINQTSGAKIIYERLAKICNNGVGFLPLKVLYQAIGQTAPAKLLKKDMESLASFVENIGFGIAPDIRYHNMKPTLEGNISVFPKGHGVDFRPSKEFRTVGTILYLGAMVSQIDQDIAPAEEALLQSIAQDNTELTRIEKDSLLAFLHWSLRTPQNTAGLKARLSGISETQKSAISHILISVAHADGEIKPEEIKQLEKLYTNLGLNKEQVTSDIHALAAENGPVTVGLRDPDTSYTITRPAQPPDTAPGFVLNEELIRIRKEETKMVKSVLEDIFAEQEEDEPDSASEGATFFNDPLSSLDEAHQNLFNRLVSRESWKRSDFQETCNSLGLMVDGAMEVLNEWALENANATLIDDGEPLYVDLSLAKEIVDVQQ